jgi:hypothetical protein
MFTLLGTLRGSLTARLWVVLALAACDPGEPLPAAELDAAQAREPDAALGAVDAEPTASTRLDGGPADASVDAARNDAGDTLDASDAAARTDLCGNVRPASPGASGVRAGSVEVLAAITQHPSVLARGPAYSSQLGGRVLWMFGPSYDKANDKSVVADNSLTLSDFARPFVLDEAARGAPAPVTLLAEQADDRARTPAGQRLGYELGSLVSIGLGDALLFYSPVTRRSGSSAVLTRLGTRVARLRGDFASIDAAVEPALLFPADAPAFRTGLLGMDGYVYLYGCQQTEKGRVDCKLARAQLGTATRAGSYRYRTAGGWSNDLSVAAAVLLDVRDDLSVSFNDYLQSYLAISLTSEGRRVLLQTAPRPEGPWSHLAAVELPAADADANELPSAAIEHAELASDCDKSLVLTYLQPLRGPDAELRPLKLELR